MNLPIAFEEKMKNLLGSEFEAYLASYQLPKYQGFRVNTLKIPLENWKNRSPFQEVKDVAWCSEGFYYYNAQPSKHPYYYAGLYYIQEPSAMSPGAYLPIEKGDKVLDICAAPGGKATQIAAKLDGTGILVANDISASRAKALLKNLENAGVANMIVCSEAPEKLAKQWPGYFDKILIDAPCSGEGMFRKDEGAIKSWESHGVAHCASLQKDILESAATMLKVGGKILYSTCTFSPEENEGSIQNFLLQHPEFTVIPLEPIGGIQLGRPEWIGADPSLKGALRLWPHHLEGEGHFLCLLQKGPVQTGTPKYHNTTLRIKDLDQVKSFIEEQTTLDLNSPIIVVGEKVYILPYDAPALDGIRVVRSGLLLGELKKKRFEPSQALALALRKDQFKHTITFNVNAPEIIKYLKGETLIWDAAKGYHVLCLDEYPLGWVKAQNSTLKNQYPPSWRMMG